MERRKPILERRKVVKPAGRRLPTVKEAEAALKDAMRKRDPYLIGVAREGLLKAQRKRP